MTHNQITEIIIGTAIEIHKRLGPGLFESAYGAILEYELKKRGLRVRREVEIPVIWEDVRLDAGYRADFIIEDKVLVELKSVDSVSPVHKKQVLTYIKLANLRLGLLINFGAEVLKDGISRIANGYVDVE